MSEPIIRFERVSKRYRRTRERPFLLRETLGRLFGVAPRGTRDAPLALDGVDLAIDEGEAVGIVGDNGAGKTTLLRMIAGTCFPTQGTVTVRGRVAPLLALGVGFHPDMTGRECIELGATVLGWSRRDLEERFATVIDFAELSDDIDSPIRVLSAGMQARLALSIAVHGRADVMLLDEILAVGDRGFQEKCLARFDALREGGTTIVVVSHSGDAIRRLCTRALWLEHGSIARDGSAAAVVAEYEAAPAKK
jgi:ABC-type polysaccharide/polyol phosphate transport system ATPase subunit